MIARFGLCVFMNGLQWGVSLAPMHIAYLDYFCVTVSLLCSAFVVAIFYPIFRSELF